MKIIYLIISVILFIVSNYVAFILYSAIAFNEWDLIFTTSTPSKEVIYIGVSYTFTMLLISYCFTIILINKFLKS
jgi:hypothetical protein